MPPRLPASLARPSHSGTVDWQVAPTTHIFWSSPLLGTAWSTPQGLCDQHSREVFTWSTGEETQPQKGSRLLEGSGVPLRRSSWPVISNNSRDGFGVWGSCFARLHYLLLHRQLCFDGRDESHRVLRPGAQDGAFQAGESCYSTVTDVLYMFSFMLMDALGHDTRVVKRMQLKPTTQLMFAYVKTPATMTRLRQGTH